MRDVLFDVSNYSMPNPKSSDMHHMQKMMSALSLASARLRKLWIPFLNRLLDVGLWKFLYFPYYLFFLAFIHDFIIYIDFTCIAASNIRLRNDLYCVEWGVKL